MSSSRRLGAGGSSGSDGWPSRFCPRRPPSVRPAPPLSGGGWVGRRRSLLSPPPAAFRFPACSALWCGRRPGSSRCQRGKRKRRRGGVGGERRRSGGCRGGRGARSPAGAPARARTGAGDPLRGGVWPLSPPVLAARSASRSPPCGALPPPPSRSLFGLPAGPGFARAPTWLILPVAYACLKD